MNTLKITQKDLMAHGADPLPIYGRYIGKALNRFGEYDGHITCSQKLGQIYILGNIMAEGDIILPGGYIIATDNIISRNGSIICNGMIWALNGCIRAKGDIIAKGQLGNIKAGNGDIECGGLLKAGSYSIICVNGKIKAKKVEAKLVKQFEIYK